MMITTGHLAKFLLTLDPRKDAGRMALYHYLLHSGNLKDPLQSQTISRFVEFALLHEHWQNHSDQLQDELEVSLHRFSETYRVRFDHENILWPRDNQIVRVRQSEQMEIILKSHLQKAGGKLKFFTTHSGDKVAVRYHDSGRLEVGVYPHLVRMHQGQLHPLRAESLTYDASLTLEGGVTQIIKSDTHSYAMFQLTERGCEGSVLRGYSLQSSLSVDGGDLGRYPTLFYPVKRLEQFFIHRRSDPMYVELVQTLEKAIQLIRDRHPEAPRFAMAAYERGRMAYEEIFPDDKLLGIALNSLEALLGARKPLTTAPAL